MAFTYLTARLGLGLRDPAGQRVLARVRLTPSTPMRNGVTTIGEIEYDVGLDGTLSGPVAATDDPATDPQDATYYVEVIPRSGQPRTFWCEVPAASPGGVFDLETAAQLTTPPAVVSTALAAHIAATTGVHGIANTALLETTSGAAAKVAAEATVRAAADTALATSLAGKQDADADLTTFAALDSSTAGVLVTDGAGWLRKSVAQMRTWLGLATIATSGKLADATDVSVAGAAVGKVLAATGVGPLTVGFMDTAELTPADIGAQPVDADLTAIAALTATTDSFLQAKAGAWSARTIAQVRTDLGIGAIPVSDPVALATAATPRWTSGDRVLASQSLAMISGTAYFSSFTAPAAGTISSLFITSKATAAATVTSNRLALFTVASDGALTLVARCASDATICNGTFAGYTRALDTTGGYPASYALVAGTRYALGALWVATTPPAVTGVGFGLPPAASAWLPWVSTSITGQSDLATSYTFASLTTVGVTPFMAAI